MLPFPLFKKDINKIVLQECCCETTPTANLTPYLCFSRVIKSNARANYRGRFIE